MPNTIQDADTAPVQSGAAVMLTAVSYDALALCQHALDAAGLGLDACIHRLQTEKPWLRNVLP